MSARPGRLENVVSCRHGDRYTIRRDVRMIWARQAHEGVEELLEFHPKHRLLLGFVLLFPLPPFRQQQRHPRRRLRSPSPRSPSLPLQKQAGAVEIGDSMERQPSGATGSWFKSTTAHVAKSRTGRGLGSSTSRTPRPAESGSTTGFKQERAGEVSQTLQSGSEQIRAGPLVPAPQGHRPGDRDALGSRRLPRPAWYARVAPAVRPGDRGMVRDRAGSAAGEPGPGAPGVSLAETCRQRGHDFIDYVARGVSLQPQAG